MQPHRTERVRKRLHPWRTSSAAVPQTTMRADWRQLGRGNLRWLSVTMVIATREKGVKRWKAR